MFYSRFGTIWRQSGGLGNLEQNAQLGEREAALTDTINSHKSHENLDIFSLLVIQSLQVASFDYFFNLFAHGRVTAAGIRTCELHTFNAVFSPTPGSVSASLYDSILLG